MTDDDLSFDFGEALQKPAAQPEHSDLKRFEFTIVNMRTNESTCFIGQGTTVGEAWSDGFKLIQEPYRPKADGRAYPPMPRPVVLPDGKRVHRALKDFESNRPFDAVKEAAANA